MRRWNSFAHLVTGALLLSLTGSSALACTACFGQSDSSMARGMNMGIFVLLLIITSVLCAIAGFFVFVARRSAALEDANHDFAKHLPEHQTNA